MANQHDTPQINSFKSYSFIFHALMSASHTRARLLCTPLCESGCLRHLPPDIADPVSRCYRRRAQSAALFTPLFLASFARQCMALHRSVLWAAYLQQSDTQHLPPSTH